MGEEMRALLSSLNDQRSHVLGILEGLSDEDLRRAVLPSGWTCLGLLQHLALDVEQFWFRGIVAGEPIELEEASTAWHVAADVPPSVVRDLYTREIEHANEIIAATHPDAPPAWWPEDLFPPDFRYHNLRQVILHVTTETAVHAGHLDVVRELTDGRRWLVMT